MSKLQTLLERQRQLAAEIEREKAAENAKHEKAIRTLIRKTGLIRFAPEILEPHLVDLVSKLDSKG